MVILFLANGNNEWGGTFLNKRYCGNGGTQQNLKITKFLMLWENFDRELKVDDLPN